MKKLITSFMLLFAVIAISGCRSYSRYPAYNASYSLGQADKIGTAGVFKRMLIWEAHLSINVDDVHSAAKEIAAITEKDKGLIQNKSDYSDKNLSVTLRIPSDKFKDAVNEISKIGEVTSKSISSEDVTAKYVDIDARVKNKEVLRDRLQKLLDKAKDVKDILMIERELNRVQSDIDSMKAQLKSMKGQADLATVYVNLRRKKIYGPLGYFFKGVFWGLEKLFVIRR